MGQLYLIRDAFGARYAEAYGIPRPDLLAFTDSSVAAVIPPADAVVAVHAGRDDALRDALDRAAFDQGIPSVGVALLPTAIVCGPAVIPGATACYSCYLRREDAAWPYDADSATRGLAEGFGPQHLAIAHGLLAPALAELRDGPAGIGATVRSFDLVTGSPSSVATVAVEECARCGVPMSVAGSARNG
ncbi:hypothetical protein [Amycolatopsis sp. CA-230715]|uniref:hypothetical protein n=1 Tax=Amycolatopsis sp. CA-230715 TaxID=2745196 RepID=UPI001C0148B8|nr:hypothetical protein [Amycolatopsis sp. CA-230715]QWF83984.1 hypothetical protein HUW46_07428 [Amycolatopsis sp. CA-230715]